MKVKNADEFYKILERKAIYPVFQPIVNLQTGDVAGYEALSRIDRHDTTLMISDLFVIAEGIETEAELECLCRLGVHYGQGYFLGRPDRTFKNVRNEAMLVLRRLNNKS